MKFLILFCSLLVPLIPKLPEPETVDIARAQVKARVIDTPFDEDAALNGFFGMAPAAKPGEVVDWKDLRTDSVYCHHFTYLGRHYWVYFTVRYDPEQPWIFFDEMPLVIDKMFLFNT